MKIEFGQLEAMEAEVVFCLEKLTQKQITSVATKYIYKDTSEVNSRYSALEQLLGELNYWLSISGSSPKEFVFDKNIISVDPIDFWRTVKAGLNPAKIVVDLGCGVRPSMLFAPDLRICVETFEPYHKYLKDRFSGIHLVIVKEDVLDFLKRQPDKSIDTLVANDLIEHLEKSKGQEVVLEIERTVINQALIFTPHGFMEQHVDEGDDGWGWSGNKQQTHLSGWLPEEFPGWKIIFSKDYHLNKGDYSDGAFAALFKPTKANQKKHFNLIVNDENLNPAELIDDVLDGLKNPLDFEFQVFLPPAYSIGSHLIRPDDSKFNLPTVFTSFNLEIRRPDSIIEIEGTSSEIGLFGLAEQLKIDARKNQSMNLIITRDNIFAETISQRVCEDKLESSNCEWIDSKDSVSLVESIIHALEKP